MKKTFNVSGMTCAVCAHHVEEAAQSVGGVKRASVNLISNTLVVDVSQDFDATALGAAVKNAGYKIVKDHNSPDSLKSRVIISFALLVPLMVCASVLTQTITVRCAQLALAVPVLIVNRSFFITGFKRLFSLKPNMDSLIATGATASFVYSLFVLGNNAHIYFESSAMILTLITLGKYLEARTKRKMNSAVEKLMKLSPQTAIKKVGDRLTEVSLEQVVPGDVLVVKAGASVPVDGVVVSGVGIIDESAITGESIPVEKNVGQSVIGASINVSGGFEMCAEKVGDDTVLAEIIRLMEEAGATKAPIAGLADKISAVFVYVVMALALTTLLVWVALGSEIGFALSAAVSVLVISCPCSLGLAVPAAMIAGISRSAQNGILIKSAAALQQMSEVKSLVFDKTGTITVGKPSVVRVTGERTRVLKYAAAAEHFSLHPLATAVVEAAQGISIPPADDFCEIVGRGVSAVCEGKKVLAGSDALMRENGITAPPLEGMGIQVAVDGEYLGAINIEDVIKEGARQTVSRLKKEGVRVVMMTGDNRASAEKIAAQTGIDEIEAQVLPQDKNLRVVEMKKSGAVAFVGDGINDAPALMSADVSVAVGNGSGIALEAADIVLMHGELNDIVKLLLLSRRTMKTVKQNLFWAFFYNIIAIPVAAGVFYPLLLSPMIAAAAMSVSSLFVLTNALRLLKMKKEVYDGKNYEY